MTLQRIYTSANIEVLPKYEQDRLAQYEYMLQDAAGIAPSANFNGLREQLAAEQTEDDINNFYAASEKALNNGADPEVIAAMAETYIPEDTRNRSLEIAAAENQTSEALIDNNITSDNIINDDELDESIGKQALQYKFSSMVDRNSPNNWTDAGKTMLSYLAHGVALDNVLVEEIKNQIPSVNWGESQSYGEMTKAFFKQYDEIYNEQGYAGLSRWIDTVGSELDNVYDPAAKQQFINIIQDNASADDLWAMMGMFSGVKSMLPAMKSAGNIKKVTGIAAMSNDIVEKIPSSVKKTVKVDPTINYPNSKTISASLQQTAKDKEIKALIDKYHQDFRVELSQNDIDNLNVLVKGEGINLDVVDYTDVVQDGDKISVNALFGTGMDKQAALSAKGAKNLAEKMGIKDYQIVKKDGSGYYIQKRIEVDAPLSELSTADFGSMGFNRVFAGSSIMPKWFHEELIAGYRKATKMEKDLNDIYGVHLRNLNAKEQNTFTNLYLDGQRANNNRGAWFDTDKLIKEGAINKREADAYNSFRIVSDIDYIVTNDKVWSKLNKLNYVNDIDGDIVKEIKTGITKTPNYSQMIIKRGNELITSKTHSAEEIEKILKESGDVLVEVSPISVKAKELQYTHKIIERGKLSKKLNRIILPYRAGGRRRYEYGTHFLKIGHTMNIGGEQVNAFSKIIGAVNDAAEANSIKDELNRALRLANSLENGTDSAQIAREIDAVPFKKININNTDDLRRITKSLDTTQQVQVLKEGESMVYNNGLRTLYEDPLDYDLAFAEIANVKGTFYNQRGQILDNLLGEEARLVSPFDIFNQTVQRASYNNSLGSLYEQMGNIFKSKYIDFIDTKTIRNPRTLSGEDLLRYGKLRDLSEVSDVHKPALREAINMQRIYHRLNNVPTATDKYIHRTMNTIGQMFHSDTIRNTDPFALGRAMLFQTTMGCFNLKQLWAQGLGAINMAFAHPIVFTRALLATPFVITGKFIPGMHGLSKGFATLTGLKPSDFDGILKYMDVMGTTMGTYRLPMSQSIKTYKILDNVGKVLRMPVEAGTNFANIVNDIAAYIEAPVKDFKKIAARADDLSMNLTRATQSAFQAGQILPTKTLSQFTSYPFRVMEAMTLNNRLTKREKAGIFLGQIAMWGITSTLLNREDAMNVNRWVNEKMQGVIPDELRKTFLNGAITTYFREQYGLEVAEGIGDSGIISSVIDLAEIIFTDKTLQEVELPGAFSALSRLIALTKAALTLPLRSEGDGDWEIIKYAQALATDPNMASGFRNLSKAFIGFNTQKAFNTQGRLIKDDIRFDQSLGMAFGMGLTESKLSSELYNIYNDMQKTVKTVYEDALQPIVKEIGITHNAPLEERQRLARKLLTALKGVRESVYKQYGIKGVKELNQHLKKGLLQRTMAADNKKYARQNVENVIRYLADIYGQN